VLAGSSRTAFIFVSRSVLPPVPAAAVHSFYTWPRDTTAALSAVPIQDDQVSISERSAAKLSLT
jgi:hypothetical protein